MGSPITTDEFAHLASRKSELRENKRKDSVSHSVVSDSATPWTVACQAPLSMEFSRQEYRSVLPFPSPGDIPNPGAEYLPLNLNQSELSSFSSALVFLVIWESLDDLA